MAQGSQFSLKDVEVVTATVNLHDVRTYRGAKASRAVQASKTEQLPQIDVDFEFDTERWENSPPTSLKIDPHYHTPEEEIALGPACWLWDYLRRSGAAGYFIPLSGGADSGAVATLVGSMCQLVAKAVREKDPAVSQDVRQWLAEGEVLDVLSDPCVLANRLLYTCYIGTENSSRDTRKRAKQLAEQIGAYHLDVNMDGLVNALQTLFTRITQRKPRFKVEGGSYRENQALQNIQARLRMVLSYLFAQTMPWVRNCEGTLLVLGTGNVDEALRGYLTKYDCSSGDINPIGGISKHDLRRFLKWAEDHLGYTALAEIVEAPPTAELEPITETYTQTDEDDMGMTYAELSRFGRLRKMEQCGPVSMFKN